MYLWNGMVWFGMVCAYCVWYALCVCMMCMYVRMNVWCVVYVIMHLNMVCMYVMYVCMVCAYVLYVLYIMCVMYVMYVRTYAMYVWYGMVWYVCTVSVCVSVYLASACSVANKRRVCVFVCRI